MTEKIVSFVQMMNKAKTFEFSSVLKDVITLAQSLDTDLGIEDSH